MSNKQEEYKFVLVNADIKQVAGWYRDGRGLRLCKNLEIGSARGDRLIPGDVKGMPHWAYGDAGSLYPPEILCEFRVAVNRPLEWLKVCERCGGTTHRTVAEMAGIWKMLYSDALAECKKDSFPWGPVDDEGNFICNFCRGTGRVQPDPIRCRVKRMFWGGYEYSQAGIKRASGMAAKLQAHYGSSWQVDFSWEHIGRGMSEANFYTVEKMSLEEYLLKNPSQIVESAVV